MKKILARQTASFKNAFLGIFWAFKTQPNMGVHLLAAVLVVSAGFYFSLSKFEWLVLALIISWVAAAEMFNTAIEIITDYMKLKKLTEEEDKFIMMAKDISAGAVLLLALGALAVGILIFAPRVFPLLG